MKYKKIKSRIVYGKIYELKINAAFATEALNCVRYRSKFLEKGSLVVVLKDNCIIDNFVYVLTAHGEYGCLDISRDCLIEKSINQ